MFSLRTQDKTILQALAVLPLFVSMAAAQPFTLKWKGPLIGLPPARCCAPMVYDPADGGNHTLWRRQLRHRV